VSGFRLFIDHKWRNYYGVSYPCTYQFDVPSGPCTVQYRKQHDGPWLTLDALAPTDTSGIDGARFDGTDAYVSVSYDQASRSRNIYLRFVDSQGIDVAATYVGPTKFYNNLNSACVLTCDDWSEGNHAKFMAFTAHCISRGIYVSAGLNAQRNATFSDLPISPAQWADIQARVDTGLLEPTNHGRTHQNPNNYNELSAYREIVLGAQDIADNLTVPPQSRMEDEQYVLGWIEPNGNDNAIAKGLRPEAGHVISRMAFPESEELPNYATFASSDETFNRQTITSNGDQQDIAVMDSRFDTSRAIGGIYHVYTHPWLEEGSPNWNPGERPTGQPGFDWDDPNEPFLDHLDHIAGHSDVWYVGWGHLYVYRLASLFVQVETVPTSPFGGRELRLDGQVRYPSKVTGAGFTRVGTLRAPGDV
jgi:hypothetical protein